MGLKFPGYSYFLVGWFKTNRLKFDSHLSERLAPIGKAVIWPIAINSRSVRLSLRANFIYPSGFFKAKSAETWFSLK